jgi:hypothetical protein
MEFMWKKIAINVESKIDDTMVTNSTIMTTCMLHFSTLLLDFYYMPKISPLHTCLFVNVAHAFLYYGKRQLHPIVIKPTLFNKPQCKLHIE